MCMHNKYSTPTTQNKCVLKHVEIVILSHTFEYCAVLYKLNVLSESIVLLRRKLQHHQNTGHNGHNDHSIRLFPGGGNVGGNIDASIKLFSNLYI